MPKPPTKMTKPEEAPPVPATPQTTAVTQYDGDLANDLLADAGAGSSGVGNEDRQIPRLTIIQSLSPQRTRNKPEYIEDAGEGDIFNTVTQDLYAPDQGCVFVPAVYQRRYTEWWPRSSKMGKGLVHDWGLDGSILRRCTKNERQHDVTPEGTLIVTSGDFFGLIVNEQDGSYSPALIGMSSTQLRKARQWNTRLTTMRITVKGQSIMPPFFYGAWKLTTQPESNDEGSWFGWKINFLGPVFDLPNGDNIYREGRLLCKLVNEGAVKVQEAPTQGDSDSTEPPPPAAGKNGPDDDIPF